MSAESLGLFDAYGVELEYMLVDRETLDVRPIADRVLAALAGETVCDVQQGPVTWSNELMLHVLELKTTQPAPQLCQLPVIFQTAIGKMHAALEPLGVQLLPTAAHPWMNPAAESQIWPHQYSEIYRRYDEIFNCRSHGWANVQSVHLNLPFRGDEEFARLHAAVRLVLPLLPALAASSPLVDGRRSGHLDTRLLAYADHCRAMPSLTGDVIPEPIFDEATYRQEIFGAIAKDIQSRDPEGVMEVDFLNARGAIARFDRGSIEIRVMDVQETAAADVAICAAAASVVRSLCEERWTSHEQQRTMPTAPLRRLFDATSSRAERAVIDDAAFAAHFGIDQPELTAQEFWARLLPQLRDDNPSLDRLAAPLEGILRSGTLSSRIIKTLGESPSRDRIASIYHRLASCLQRGELFQP